VNPLMVGVLRGMPVTEDIEKGCEWQCVKSVVSDEDKFVHVNLVLTEVVPRIRTV